MGHTQGHITRYNLPLTRRSKLRRSRIPSASGGNKGRWGGQGRVSPSHVRTREFLPAWVGSGEGSGCGKIVL